MTVFLRQRRFCAPAMFLAAGWLVLCEPICAIAAGAGHHAHATHDHAGAAVDHHHSQHHIKPTAGGGDETGTQAAFVVYSEDRPCCDHDPALRSSQNEFEPVWTVVTARALAFADRHAAATAWAAYGTRGPPPNIVLQNIPFQNSDALLI